jgi:general secretion pathway protein D
MNRLLSSWKTSFAIILACSVTMRGQAQFFPGQGGTGGAQGGGASRSRSGSSTRQYPVNGTVGDAIFSIDPDTRRLVVIADEETGRYISEVVSNLDRPKPQVLIKVVFLEVTYNNSSDIGVEGAWGKGIGNSTTAAAANAFGLSGISSAIGSNAPLANAFGSPLGSFLPNPPGAGLYQIFAQDYQVTLRAIAQAGKTKVLSRPSVVARNSQPATITVGQSVPLITAVRYDTLGNAINSVTYQSVGIILRVTPFITSGGQVEMILSPETSELVADRTQWVPISSGPGGSVSAPLINQRSADTVVVTPDNQTVILGGMLQNSKAEGESKIPLLGDIPLLGNLFKRKTKSDGRTELIIFLTPHIIEAPAQMAALSESEREKSEASKALTEKELNLFLDNLPALDPDKDKPHKRK